MSYDLEIEFQDWSKIKKIAYPGPTSFGFFILWINETIQNLDCCLILMKIKNYGSAESATLPATMVRVTVGIPAMDHDNPPIIRAI